MSVASGNSIRAAALQAVCAGSQLIWCVLSQGDLTSRRAGCRTERVQESSHGRGWRLQGAGLADASRQHHARRAGRTAAGVTGGVLCRASHRLSAGARLHALDRHTCLIASP